MLLCGLRMWTSCGTIRCQAVEGSRDPADCIHGVKWQHASCTKRKSIPDTLKACRLHLRTHVAACAAIPTRRGSHYPETLPGAQVEFMRHHALPYQAVEGLARP